MRLPIVAVAVAVGAAGAASADAKLPPLRDPVFLNIGFVCEWQEACITKQQKAHKRRRASFRRTGRVDWISYYHCISNAKIAGATASSRNRR